MFSGDLDTQGAEKPRQKYIPICTLLRNIFL